MMRAAIYARYSTDLQSERSIEDQFALCLAYAAREGLSVVAQHDDRARSGGTLTGRPGLAAIMDLAAAGAIDIIVVEALDRISRDMEDLAGIYKRLSFAGIRICAVHEGEVTTVLVGLRGLVGQLYREDNAHKVRRGLRGRFGDGIMIGRPPYGYRLAAGQVGQREIAPAEAAVLTRIFTDYVAGRSPRAIAAALNAEGVPPPETGRGWHAASLQGNARRGSGILRNEHYAGVIRWGRQRNVRNPDTGKVVKRAATCDCISIDRPDLAIVSRELWQAAQDRLARLRAGPASERREPRHLLSGLLRCGACGSAMVGSGKAHGRTRIRCAGYAMGRICPAPRTVYLDIVQEAVIKGLRAELRAPAAIAEFIRAYHEERRRLAAEGIEQSAPVEAPFYYGGDGLPHLLDSGDYGGKPPRQPRRWWAGLRPWLRRPLAPAGPVSGQGVGEGAVLA